MNEDIIAQESEAAEAPEEIYESEQVAESSEAEEIPEANEREELLAQINALEEKIATLEKERSMQQRTVRELEEFSSLFPEARLEAIPDEVWASVRQGGSLAASYALYEARCRREAEKTKKINADNASRSAGRAGVGTAQEYFSPEEVRKMSPSEVHANYAKIKDSMKKWL